MGENLFVGHVAQSYRIELVGLHEFVEDVGAQYYGARDGYCDAVKTVADGIFLDDRVYEGQTAAFASERSLAYAGKVGVLVEAVLAEYGHDAAVFHLAIFDDEVKEQLPHLGGVADVAEPVLLDDLGYREECARVEPARDVVERRVPVECLGRDVEN